MDVPVVSKVAPSWNTEVDYGAVAFDGRRRVERLRAGRGVHHRGRAHEA
jgi:hypothetical protein